MNKRLLDVLNKTVFIAVMIIVVLCIDKTTIYASSFYIVNMDGKTIYYVDDMQVTETQYYDLYYEGTSKDGYITLSDGSLRWYCQGTYVANEDEYWKKMAQKTIYYSVGRLGTKSDGTVLWYGANKLYNSENEAIAGYVASRKASGGYKKEDGTYVWFWQGSILKSKEEYGKKAAVGAGDGWRTISDGSILYYYNDKAYFTKKDYYEAHGYTYCATEAEGKALIDKWFADDNSATEMSLIVNNGAALDKYFEDKLSKVAGSNVYLTYRDSIFKSKAVKSSIDEEGDLEVYISISTEQFGTEAQIKEARTAAKKVADTLRNKSKYEQIKGAYDWLCKNVAYDYSYSRHSAYSALIEKKTVCEGYAAAFQLIMEELGIECHTAISTDHAWNAVKYEGKWYWVDATWGDQVSYIDYGWFLCGTNKRKNATTINISSSSYNGGSGSQGSGGSDKNNPTQKESQSNVQKETESSVEQITSTEEVTTVVEQVTTEVVTEKESQKEELTTEEVTTEMNTSETNTTVVDEISKDNNSEDDGESSKGVLMVVFVGCISVAVFSGIYLIRCIKEK